MARNSNATTDAPEIEKVQYNVAGTEHIFEGVEGVEQEYCEHINHDDWAVRIVFDNGNWMELRKVDDETMEECVFIQEQHPTGEYEAFLQDSTEVGHIDASTLAAFYEAVDTNIEVYQMDVETVEDAESMWSTIVPALE